MDLQTIFNDFSMAELMAPSSDLSFMQDAKFHINDAPVQQGNSNSIQTSDVFNEPDVSVQQPQLNLFQSSNFVAEHVADDSTVNEPCTTVYNQHSGTSSLPYGMNLNAPASVMQSNDEFIFDGLNLDFEQPKRDHSLMVDYSDSSYSADKLFSPQKSSQAASFSLDTSDAFVAQVQEGHYPHEAGMIPSVVDHGAEILAAAAASKNEQAQPRQNGAQNPVVNCKNNTENVSRKSKTGPSRRRSSKGPKPKLHQRTEPFLDVGMETKRKNAIKAHKNRLKAKEEKEIMEAEISRLKKLLQEKEDIIQRLIEERRVEKGNRIRALREELNTLTVSYNSL